MACEFGSRWKLTGLPRNIVSSQFSRFLMFVSPILNVVFLRPLGCHPDMCMEEHFLGFSASLRSSQVAAVTSRRRCRPASVLASSVMSSALGRAGVFEVGVGVEASGDGCPQDWLNDNVKQ